VAGGIAAAAYAVPALAVPRPQPAEEALVIGAVLTSLRGWWRRSVRHGAPGRPWRYDVDRRLQAEMRDAAPVVKRARIVLEQTTGNVLEDGIMGRWPGGKDQGGGR
jgi:hypothetical protein